MEEYFGGSYGWICPKCGKVHAPWDPECDCNNLRTVATTNGICCQHSWRTIGQSSAGMIYQCEYCGTVKTEPPPTPSSITTTTGGNTND